MQFALQRRGMLIVISAPSGGGKSTALARLRKRDPSIGYSVSYTTRPPRPGEEDGKAYRFVSRETFQQMIDENAFYEYAEVHGNLYGTARKTVEEALSAGSDLAMDIDVQGGLAVKRRAGGDAVLVFLLPPSMETLERRLRDRRADDEAAIRIRLRNAEGEIAVWPQYDYVVLNETLDRTVREIEEIVNAERKKTARLELKDKDE